METDGRKWTSLSVRCDTKDRVDALGAQLHANNNDEIVAILLDFAESQGAAAVALAALDREQARLDARRKLLLESLPQIVHSAA